MNKYSSYVLYLLISILVVILYVNDFGPLAGLQQKINDRLAVLTAPGGERPNIALINIDQRAQEEYGAWPWNRDLIADLLAATAGGEPRAIVLDIDLSEDAAQDSAGYTAILAGQMNWIKNVVLPYDIALASFRSKNTATPEHLFKLSLAIDTPLGLMDEDASLLTRKVFLPADKLISDDPYLGFNYIMPDDDRILRHQPLAMNYLGYYYPSVALMAASVYQKIPPSQVTVVESKEIQIGTQTVIPITEGAEMYIRPYPASSFRTYSAADILNDGFDYSVLKDGMVLIGVESDNPDDSYTTAAREEAPGLVITASAIENIINDNLLNTGSGRSPINMAVLFLLGGLCAFVMPQIRLRKRLVLLLAGMVATAAVQYYMVAYMMILPQTVYVLLELLLFMGAAPVLDVMLRSDEESDEVRYASKAEKASIDRREQDIPVREIAASPDDPECQPTRIIDPSDSQSAEAGDEATTEVPFEDYGAINIDGETASAKSPEPSRQENESEADGNDLGIIPTGEENFSTESEPNIISPGSSVDSVDSEAPTTSAPITPPAGIAPPQTGATRNLGRYQITGELGKGAMGTVYRGVDPAINRPVALKTIRLDFVTDPEEEAELKERLHREAQAAGKLSHPNIVTIYDVGSEGSLQYIAMEYLEGQTLEEMIKKKVKFNYRIIAQIIMQICDALQYAHERQIVHRDIKPANIMIMKNYQVKVMDYGIARVESNSMTKTGIAMGTPNYISPEQLRGQKIDNRADIFSLGVVIYELVVGKRPFRGENITSLIYNVLNHEPEKPSNVVPQIPLLFDQICFKALQKEPSGRYQQASELMADMSDFVEAFSSKG